MKYLKVWTDFEDVLQMLDPSEVGRLFLAMLHYAASGEEPDGLFGNERYVWPVAKRDIDHAADESRILRENGLKGGRPKTKQNQTEPDESKQNQMKPNETKENQSEPNESQKEKKGNEIKRNEMKSSFMDADDAQEIQKDHDRILDAAEDAGFKMSNDVRASLIALYADNGLTKLLDALKSCVDHGAPNLAYLKAVLKGESKKKIVNAQKYDQRDYDEVENEAYQRMIRGIVS